MRLSTLTAALLIAAAPACLASAAQPTDPQIAHIAYTAGVLDIEAAKLAQKRSKNAEIVSFADDMVRDHQAVNDQALALVGKLGVTPEDNDTSKALAAAAKAKQAELEALDGPAFDKAYAENEVAYHRTVNEALESTLIPNASNPELKALLTTGLKIFQGHQEHAEQLAAGLK